MLKKGPRNVATFENNRFSTDYDIIGKVASTNQSNSNSTTFFCKKQERELFVTKYRQEINLGNVDLDEYKTAKELAEAFLKVFIREMKQLQKSPFTSYTEHWLELEEPTNLSKIFLNIYIEELKLGRPFRESLNSTTSQAVKLTLLQQIMRMSVQQFSNVYLTSVKQRGLGLVPTTSPEVVLIDGQCKLDHHQFIGVLISQTLKDRSWCEKERTLDEKRERYLKTSEKENANCTSEEKAGMLRIYSHLIENKTQLQRDRNWKARQYIWRQFLCRTILELFVEQSHLSSPSNEAKVKLGLEQIKQLLSPDEFFLFMRIHSSKYKTDLKSIAHEVHQQDQEKRYQKMVEQVADAPRKSRPPEKNHQNSIGPLRLIRFDSPERSSTSPDSSVEQRRTQKQRKFENGKFASEYTIIEELLQSRVLNRCATTYVCTKENQTVQVTKYRLLVNHNEDYKSPTAIAEAFLKLFCREMKQLQKSPFTTFTEYWIEQEELDDTLNIILNTYVEELYLGTPFKECVKTTNARAVKLALLQDIIRMSVQQYSNIYLAGVKERENGFEYTKGPGVVLVDGQCKLDHHHFIEVLISHTLEDVLWCEKERSQTEERESYLKILREDKHLWTLTSEEQKEMLKDHLEIVRNRRLNGRKRNSSRRHSIWQQFLCRTFMELFVEESIVSFCKFDKSQLEKLKPISSLREFCLITRIFTSQSKTDLVKVAAEIHIQYSDQEKRYAKVRKLGRGGFGEVQLAKHKTSNQYYAIKVIRVSDMKKSVNELIDELKDTVCLSGISRTKMSNKLITYYDAFLTEDHSNWLDDTYPEDDSPITGSLTATFATAPETFNNENYRYLFIVMEACSHSLSYEIKKKGVCHSVTLIQEVMDAIGHLNSNGYMHRDVKPDNFLVTKRGKFVLSDLDSIKRIIKPSEDGQLPLQSIICTPEYSSPELHSRRYTEKTDYYSLGVSFLQTLFGMGDRKHLKSLKSDLFSQKIEQDLIMNPLLMFLLRWLTDENPENRSSAEHITIMKKLLTQQQRRKYKIFKQDTNWIILQNKQKPHKFQRMIRISADYETMRTAIRHYIDAYTFEGDFNFESLMLVEDMSRQYKEHQFTLLKTNNDMSLVPAKDKDCAYICSKEATITIYEKEETVTNEREDDSRDNFLFFTLYTCPKLNVYQLLDYVFKIIAAKKTHGALEIIQMDGQLIIQYLDHLVDKLPDNLLHSSTTLLWSPEMLKYVRDWRPESDVFSFGLLLYYLLTSEKDDEIKTETMRSFQSGKDIVPMEGLGIGWQQQISWMCRPNHKARSILKNFKIPQKGVTSQRNLSFALQKLRTSNNLRVGTDILPHFSTIPGFGLFQEDFLLENHNWMKDMIIGPTECGNKMLDIDQNDKVIWVPIAEDCVEFLMMFDYFNCTRLNEDFSFESAKLLISQEEYGKLVDLHVYVMKILNTLQRSHANGFTHGNIAFISLTENKFWIGFPSFEVCDKTEEFEAAAKKDIYDVGKFLNEGLKQIFKSDLAENSISPQELIGIPKRVRAIYSKVISQMTAPNVSARPSAAELVEKSSIFSRLSISEDDVQSERGLACIILTCNKDY